MFRFCVGLARSRDVVFACAHPPHIRQDIDDLKRQVQQMQEEAEKLEEIQKEVEAQMGSPTSANAQSVDSRSVYVGNVRLSITSQCA